MVFPKIDEETVKAVEVYGQAILRRPHFIERSENCALVCTGTEPGIVTDYLLLSDSDTIHKLVIELGNRDVIDDHDVLPWVFVKLRSYDWLRNDLQRRLAIALWLYRNAIIIHESSRDFRSIVEAAEESFANQLTAIIKQKYLEMRTERHNLRHACQLGEANSCRLIAATVVKIALEILFLVHHSPYPYKKRLFPVVEQEYPDHVSYLQTCKNFIQYQSLDGLIEKSDLLVNEVNNEILSFGIPDSVVTNWWMHLS